MVLLEFKPHYLLAEIARTYRIVNFKFDSVENLPCKPYPPKAEQCLSFYPYDREDVVYANSRKEAGKLNAVVFGQQTELTNRYVGSNFLLIQIVFAPGGLFRITGIPSTEIANAYVDAEAIFFADIRFVNEQLCHCSSYQQMVAVIDKFLFSQIKKRNFSAHAIDQVMQGLYCNEELPSIDALSRLACVSTRQFERIFKHRMGVSPKYFLKVMRFENAFRMKNKFPHLDWLSIAIRCGYYDYQHLVKDYKELTLMTPTEFHHLDLSSPERMFGDKDVY